MSEVSAGACSVAVTLPVARDTTRSLRSYSPVLPASTKNAGTFGSDPPIKAASRVGVRDGA
jgi:hypothetical protein